MRIPTHEFIRASSKIWVDTEILQVRCKYSGRILATCYAAGHSIYSVTRLSSGSRRMKSLGFHVLCYYLNHIVWGREISHKQIVKGPKVTQIVL